MRTCARAYLHCGDAFPTRISAQVVSFTSCEGVEMPAHNTREYIDIKTPAGSVAAVRGIEPKEAGTVLITIVVETLLKCLSEFRDTCLGICKQVRVLLSRT